MTCLHCGQPILHKLLPRQHRYCSKTCRYAKNDERRRERVIEWKFQMAKTQIQQRRRAA